MIYLFCDENNGRMKPSSIRVFDSVCNLGKHMIYVWEKEWRHRKGMAWTPTFQNYITGGPYGYTPYKVYTMYLNSSNPPSRKLTGKKVWTLFIECKDLERDLIKTKLRE